jgi:hypothetical protein
MEQTEGAFIIVLWLFGTCASIVVGAVISFYGSRLVTFWVMVLLPFLLFAAVVGYSNVQNLWIFVALGWRLLAVVTSFQVLICFWLSGKLVKQRRNNG